MFIFREMTRQVNEKTRKAANKVEEKGEAFGKWKDGMTRERTENEQVNSPVQSRACQQVSMYHRLLIASQYLATWFPPLYRPHLPPLHLPRPEGTSMTISLRRVINSFEGFEGQ